MRVTYSISWDNFLATQRRFDFAATRGRGFLVSMVGSLLALGAGVLMLSHHLAAEHLSVPEALAVSRVAFFLILVGGGVLGWVLVRDKASAMRGQRDFEEVLRSRFQSLHCRDKRFVEIGLDGLCVGCECNETKIPWNNLRAIAETPAAFVFSTAKDAVIVPKEVLSTEAERTQLRSAVASKSGEITTSQGRAVNVQCTVADWKQARWLVFRAGAWRIALVRLLFAGWVSYILVIASVAMDSRIVPDRALVAGAALIALVVLFLPLKPLPRYVGNFVAWFSESGIQLQFPWGQTAVDWHRISRFTFDSGSLLLVFIDKSRLLIPRRCFSEAQWQIVRQLLESKAAHG